MNFSTFLKENHLKEEELSKEAVWKKAQQSLIFDIVSSLLGICLSNDEIDAIIKKIEKL